MFHVLMSFKEIRNYVNCHFQTMQTQVKQWYKGSDRYLWFKQDIDENFNVCKLVDIFVKSFLLEN